MTRIVRIAGATRIMAEDQPEFETLPIRDQPGAIRYPDGRVVECNEMVCCLAFEPDEIEKINQGENLYVSLMGTSWPPILVTVGDVRPPMNVGGFPPLPSAILATYEPFLRSRKLDSGDLMDYLGADAVKWAVEFMVRFMGKNVGGDDLIGWFANAIHAGEMKGRQIGRRETEQYRQTDSYIIGWEDGYHEGYMKAGGNREELDKIFAEGGGRLKPEHKTFYTPEEISEMLSKAYEQGAADTRDGTYADPTPGGRRMSGAEAERWYSEIQQQIRREPQDGRRIEQIGKILYRMLDNLGYFPFERNIQQGKNVQYCEEWADRINKEVRNGDARVKELLEHNNWLLQQYRDKKQELALISTSDLTAIHQVEEALEPFPYPPGCEHRVDKITFLKQSIEQRTAMLQSIDNLLARRPALDKFDARYDKINHALSENARLEQNDNVLKIVKEFIATQEITALETVYQTDRVAAHALILIENLVKEVGLHVPSEPSKAVGYHDPD